jgi:hypothetical protein
MEVLIFKTLRPTQQTVKSHWLRSNVLWNNSKNEFIFTHGCVTIIMNRTYLIRKQFCTVILWTKICNICKEIIKNVKVEFINLYINLWMIKAIFQLHLCTEWWETANGWLVTENFGCIGRPRLWYIPVWQTVSIQFPFILYNAEETNKNKRMIHVAHRVHLNLFRCCLGPKYGNTLPPIELFTIHKTCLEEKFFIFTKSVQEK